MLFLARADKGKTAEEMTSISLAAEARSVADYVEAVLEERHIRLSIDGDATVKGNGPLLRRALLNLVSNALRYTGEEGAIIVRIARMHGGKTFVSSEAGVTEVGFEI